MNYTQNYNLKKPEQTDYYNIDDQNENTEIIDNVLAEKQNTLTAGANITIVNDVISASGGGGGGDAVLWKSTETYPANATVIHDGAVWTNTSGASTTGVEPSTNYNVWNVSYCNENLLDNSHFTVNQRGQTSYSVSGYTVDRWKIVGEGSAILTDGVLHYVPTTASNLRQILGNENLDNKIVTFSAIIKGEGILIVRNSSGTGIASKSFSSVDYSVVSITLTVPANSGRLSVELNCPVGGEFYAKVAKLELGSISTIANDGVPNYAEELAKCQRYLFAYNQTKASASAISTGYASSTTQVRTLTALPVTMASKPTAIFSNVSNYRIRNADGSNVASALTVDAPNINQIFLVLTSTALIPNSPYDIYSTGYENLLLSCEP